MGQDLGPLYTALRVKTRRWVTRHELIWSQGGLLSNWRLSFDPFESIARRSGHSANRQTDRCQQARGGSSKAWTDIDIVSLLLHTSGLFRHLARRASLPRTRVRDVTSQRTPQAQPSFSETCQIPCIPLNLSEYLRGDNTKMEIGDTTK